MMRRMLYYYVVPCYLTGVFLVAYLVVRLILGVFDLANPFWDAWDRWKRSFAALGILEYVILLAFIYYIVYYELSGAPEPTQKEGFWQILKSYF